MGQLKGPEDTIYIVYPFGYNIDLSLHIIKNFIGSATNLKMMYTTSLTNLMHKSGVTKVSIKVQHTISDLLGFWAQRPGRTFGWMVTRKPGSHNLS